MTLRLPSYLLPYENGYYLETSENQCDNLVRVELILYI